jgi:hypothetical protein
MRKWIGKTLCSFGFHRAPTCHTGWFPFEGKCPRCGCRMFMDTRGEWFKAVVPRQPIHFIEQWRERR